MAKKGRWTATAPILRLDHGGLQLTRSDATAKSRLISVRLISMAMTGYFYQFTRPRTNLPMSMLKYDPIGRRYPWSDSGALENHMTPLLRRRGIIPRSVANIG